MGIFATLVRRGAHAEPARGASWADGVVHGVPVRFEPVLEQLQAGLDPTDACAEIGRELARDGAALGEALDGLQATWAVVVGCEPDYRATRALSEAWGEESLGYLHQLSCEDPLTGLVSLAHLQARVSEVYRGAEQGGMSPSESHALVLVDLPRLARPSAWDDPFEATLRLVQLAETARTVFPGEESIAKASPSRLVVLARRGNLLARRVGLLRDLVDTPVHDLGRARVWVEGLPRTTGAAAIQLDEIARS
ncbi:MAG: hypothetical protein JOZ82_00245 [Marmoricola sp.]|nr:hypothetical protein [Marmoricola sp.]